MRDLSTLGPQRDLRRVMGEARQGPKRVREPVVPCAWIRDAAIAEVPKLRAAVAAAEAELRSLRGVEGADRREAATTLRAARTELEAAQHLAASPPPTWRDLRPGVPDDDLPDAGHGDLACERQGLARDVRRMLAAGWIDLEDVRGVVA